MLKTISFESVYVCVLDTIFRRETELLVFRVLGRRLNICRGIRVWTETGFELFAKDVAYKGLSWHHHSTEGSGQSKASDGWQDLQPQNNKGKET